MQYYVDKAGKQQYGTVSIPQAVSTIAIQVDTKSTGLCEVRTFVSFNTASGKYYCNHLIYYSHIGIDYEVSIPQAVSTIAIAFNFNNAKVLSVGFNTASGKYYCNDTGVEGKEAALAAFQYRKR